MQGSDRGRTLTRCQSSQLKIIHEGLFNGLQTGQRKLWLNVWTVKPGEGGNFVSFWRLFSWKVQEEITGKISCPPSKTCNFSTDCRRSLDLDLNFCKEAVAKQKPFSHFVILQLQTLMHFVGIWCVILCLYSALLSLSCWTTFVEVANIGGICLNHSTHTVRSKIQTSSGHFSF